MTERIGFVGVGRMGANMARRMKDAGYPVTVIRTQQMGGADLSKFQVVILPEGGGGEGSLRSVCA